MLESGRRRQAPLFAGRSRPCGPKWWVGARRCAEHQPQRVASTRAAEIFPDLDGTRRLRLVCNTAALRPAGQSTNNFGMRGRRALAVAGPRRGRPQKRTPSQGRGARRVWEKLAAGVGKGPGSPKKNVTEPLILLIEKEVWRRGSESNRRMQLLQSRALPLGYPARGPWKIGPRSRGARFCFSQRAVTSAFRLRPPKAEAPARRRPGGSRRDQSAGATRSWQPVPAAGTHRELGKARTREVRTS